MPIKTACPKCDTPYTLGDGMRGKQVRCKSCDKMFTVAGTGLGANGNGRVAAGRPGAGSRRPLDDDDDRPRRRGYDDDDDRPRRRDDDDDDDRPRRQKKKGKGLLIGLICGAAALVIGGGVLVLFLL